MTLPGFLRSKQQMAAEIERLERQVGQLQEDLTFLRSKHEVLLAEGETPRQENAVLRYDLQKCQRDRQVLDWHLGATRGELRLTLALLRAYDATPDARGRALLQQAALLAHEARLVRPGAPAVAGLASAVEEAWGARFPGEALPGVEQAVALRAAHLLADLEAAEASTADPVRADPARADAESGDARDGGELALRAALSALIEGLTAVPDTSPP
ncbi:MAG: hypothetical protein P8Y02_08050 [Deinococcales bacterium]